MAGIDRRRIQAWGPGRRRRRFRRHSAVVWREQRAARSGMRGGLWGSRGSWLLGVCEREELRDLAELKHSPDGSVPGNDHEVDVQPCSVASEFEDAVNAA